MLKHLLSRSHTVAKAWQPKSALPPASLWDAVYLIFACLLPIGNQLLAQVLARPLEVVTGFWLCDWELRDGLVSLADWLVDRRHCNLKWQSLVRTIREKINAAIQDMPESEEIAQLLSGSCECFGTTCLAPPLSWNRNYHWSLFPAFFQGKRSACVH